VVIPRSNSTDGFKPAWWLPGPHSQTIYASLFRKHVPLKTVPERLDLDDGDFLDLVWDADNYKDHTKAIVIILHGMGGSIHSSYALSLMQSISLSGCRPLFMHFRGASGEPNRFARSYHAGETADLAFVIRYLQSTNPAPAISAVGISLGGNVLLKYLGETGLHSPLKSAVTISNPFNLAETSKHIGSGLARLYQRYLLHHLRKQVEPKLSLPGFPISAKDLRRIKSLREFDELLTAPLHGFASADHYYEASSSLRFLKSIERPCLIIYADDDPLMPPGLIPHTSQLSPHIQLELTKGGGHVGFVSGARPGQARLWFCDRVQEFFQPEIKSSSSIPLEMQR